MPLTLTREIRFGLHEGEAGAYTDKPGEANGFAGNPALAGIAPFLCLSATVAGEIDAKTGMLVNIKFIDSLLRTVAVPMMRQIFYQEEGHGRRVTAEEALLKVFHEKTDEDRVFYRDVFSPHALVSLRLKVSPFLRFTVHTKELEMVEMSLRFEFSAAHRLNSESLSDGENRETFGRCNNPNGHGHNYELEVTVAGKPEAKSGQVMPIHLLQQIVNREILDPFDHKHLNLDCAEFQAGKGLNPTVENIVVVLYRRLKPHIKAPVKLTSIRLWETPKTMAEYGE